MNTRTERIKTLRKRINLMKKKLVNYNAELNRLVTAEIKEIK